MLYLKRPRSERTIYRKADRFDAQDLAGLFETIPPAPRHALPVAIRRAIVELKAEHPAFRPHELARICYARFGRRPSPHTVKRVLAEDPIPVRAVRRYPPYVQIADPVERRLAIVHLQAEGWSVSSIAGYLQTTRRRVYQTLQRWVAEGAQGLDEKSHAPKHPARKTDLAAINAVRELQVNPELGAFRIYAALQQLGITLSLRTCGRILARNRKLYGLRGPEAKPREPKAMPFKADRRHRYWTVDIRYLDHHLGEGNVYCLSILDNYSRLIVASQLSRTQDLSAFLAVLFAAVRDHGAPEGLVSDGGTVFRAKQAGAIYRALGITKEMIAPRQAWQSSIGTTFNIQRRMADWYFPQAESWGELLKVHATWVADYNTQEHWAHQRRQDGRRSPKDVLGWYQGRIISPEELARNFAPLLFRRRLDQQGYVRFRHWRI